MWYQRVSHKKNKRIPSLPVLSVVLLDTLKIILLHQEHLDYVALCQGNCIVLVIPTKLEGWSCRKCDWCPQQESNLQLALRRGSLYPFNYGDFSEDIIRILAVSIST